MRILLFKADDKVAKEGHQKVEHMVVIKQWRKDHQKLKRCLDI